ncbi:putative late blight resistance protein homolog R1A-4 isoform X2 [Ipomoea triloba]|uniref:putative late blight resistance protein homolog R1A-4 isoform X2 n=1 Tax=Ipomoea triloba TaxID=35885 RepID=UPI00125D5F4B|nr:putative late blight resistance protein homolog R1A-4 isoform X2 [Ipomoea triloba]
MACVALTSLMATIELELLQPTARVCLHDDEASIKSLFENLSSLQTFLEEESSGDDAAALNDLEIQIRDFALKAEDDIEIQLSKFLLAEDDTEHQENAYQELLQILREAADQIELLKIVSREKDSFVSEREMGRVALTNLITKFEYYFLQPNPMVCLHDDDEAAIIKSLFEKLSSLQTFLQTESSCGKELEIKIRDFALKAEDDICSNILLAKHRAIRPNNKKIMKKILGGLNDYMCFRASSHRENNNNTSQELLQTLREAAEIAAELLMIINKEKRHCAEREMICNALTSLRQTIHEIEFLHDEPETKSFFGKLSSLQTFLQEESSGSGAMTKDLKTKIIDFALKAEHLQIQLSNFFQSKHTTSSQENASRGLHQDLQEATENATELLKIITKGKECHESAREMTSDALTIFMKKFDYYFLQSNPVVFLDDEAAKISFFEKLSSMQALLQDEESSAGGAIINDLKTEIINFVLKAEDDIDTQVNNLLQADDTEDYQQKASQLNQTLQGAAENAEGFLMVINSKKECNEIEEMACNALSSLMVTIQQGFHDDETVIKSLLEKISSFQAFLKKKSSGGGGMTDLEAKIKDFAIKAGDDIKVQINNFLQAKDTEYQEKFSISQELHQTVREAAESAAELLKIIINSKSNEVDEANETQPSNCLVKYDSKLLNAESDGSLLHFLKLEDRMVGRHHDCRVIKDQLLTSHYELPKIISIVGMVGIGKTTLARNVYEDPSIASHFDVRGWITIPHDYNKSQMLCNLLQSITPVEPNVIKKGSTPDELEMQVCKCLLGRKYLIVLDNILSNQALIDIRQCVPNDKGGSCILLTTSHYKQEYYHSNYIHHMALLDPKESWDVFCSILLIKKHLAPKFENIRNSVVEKCDGLPKLIVEVAKRLSKFNNIQQGWKKIEKELESLGFLDRNALMVTYNMLPRHLKVCFLYFGVFPKRNKVLVKKLIRLWIAEGFVKPLNHNELEDEAYMYLQELIDRSLLLIEDRSCNGKIKICRMHSALHSFCVGEAQKGGILCAVDTQQHSGLSLKAFANSCRWLSFYSHHFDYYVLFGTNIPRSIFFFHENPEMCVPLKLLRVLAFDTSIFLQRVPVHLRDLVFLRYLSVAQWYEGLDEVVSNNPNLQTLVVSRDGVPTVHLPSSIWKPPHLRHLELGNSYMVDPPSMVKESLQSLSCVWRSIHCKMEVFDKLPNIKKLKIFLKEDIEASHHPCGSSRNPIVLDYLDYLKELEKLTISVSVGCAVILKERSMFPSKLKKLRLSGINLSKRDLMVIGALPQLMVLELRNTFHGRVWDVYDRGFLNLRFLLVEDRKLKHWACDYDTFSFPFPKLEHLVLRFCCALEEIPYIFTDIPNLQLIVLEQCHSSLVTSAKWIQEEKLHYTNHILENTHTNVSTDDKFASLTLSQ